MSKLTLQEQVNKRKKLFLQLLKEQGKYLHYCSERGYVYEIVRNISGTISRIHLALKNGVLQVLNVFQEGKEAYDQ